jgi:hypothetical protein
MNYGRIALAGLASTIVYFVVRAPVAGKFVG